MPYQENDDLPPSVRNHLPPHGQDIFRHAFNEAFEQYSGDESAAFRVAWSAVKRCYEKDTDDAWVRKTS